MYQALSDVQDRSCIFTKWGGHAAAAGFSLKSDDIERLRYELWDVLEGNWSNNVELEPHAYCDVPLELQEPSFELVDGLRLLEPFGQSNPEPVFFVRDARVNGARMIGSDGKHLKMWVSDDMGNTHTVLAFGRGGELDDWRTAGRRHLLVTVGANEWNGAKTIQMLVVDAK